MQNANSYWQATANNTKKRPSLFGEQKTEVTIIGGGFSGLATSYFLNCLGIKTILIEQHSIGWGASGRNAGMLTTGFKKSTAVLSKKLGTDRAKELLKMSVDCIRLVDEVAKKEKIDCSLNYNGGLKLAYKSKHFDALRREHEFMLEKFNYQTEIIPPSDIEKEINSPIYAHGGLMDPHSYAFHPLNYAIGLGDAVERLGGIIYENSQVTSVNKFKDGYIVKTEDGEIVSNEVVVATNGYTTTNTNKKLTKSIMPIESHVITTEPLPKELSKRLIPHNRVSIDTKNFLYYFRMMEDYRLLFGGRVSFVKKNNSQNNPELYEVLRRNMVTVFPELKDTKVDYQWGGTTAFTFDFMPHLGKTEEGLFYMTGFCGHGAAMSTLLGKIIASSIAEKNQLDNVLGDLPLTKIPFHNQRGKILSLAENYLKVIDKIS
ncbi:FAD-binding oxidoreductase [Virgibacillus dakarensis]|nr:FAD-binding oxidoreductase [Virgibacillus dakarensis]